MSTLDDLLRQVGQKDAQLAEDLAREIKALKSRRAFGLNFERHTPESVELPGRPIRKGDKVRFLPKRGDPVSSVDKTLWQVVGFRNSNDGRVAMLARPSGQPDEPENAERLVDDLVVVAEFRDPIYPGLKSTGKVERGGDKPYHTVINAENYHALQALLYTHAGKVDAIYIDPPYNTGAKDWKYNNDYVDSEDAYRHSKWLAFMERRLKLAKQLLNPACSVLVLAIDENEIHRIGLLLEQIFTQSKIQTVTVLINPAGASIIDQFSRVDELLLFVHVGSAKPARTTFDTTPGTSTFVTADGKAKRFQWESFLRSGGNSRRQDTKAKFFPVYIDRESSTILGCGDHLPEGIPISAAPPGPPGSFELWPIKTDGTEACWQTSAPTFRKYLAEGRIRLGRWNKKSQRYGISFLPKGAMKAISAGELVVDGRDEKGALIVRNAEGRVRSQVGKTIWTNIAMSATEYGSTLLRSFIPRRKFPFPKSLYAVEEALRFYIGDKPDSTVVDFFAGSGTTAHAVMRLNKQDGGRRQCISVTNNEVSADEQKGLRDKGLRPGDPEWERWGICDYITKPRIKAAITGRTPEGEPIQGDYKFTDEFPMADGFEENVEFFTMSYEAPRRVAHHRSFAAIAPLLWLKAGARGKRIEEAVEDFAVADAYGILFDPDRSQGFVKALTEHPKARMAFIVTDDDRAYQAVCKALPEHIEPVRLYASYLTSFTINTGRE